MKPGSGSARQKAFRRVSSMEVAREAGVSQSAVSRVFTPGASASPVIKEKVLAAAAKLGYRPNMIARSLIRQSTRMIGIAVARFTNPMYAFILKEFTRKLQARGYWTLILNIAEDSRMEEALPVALQYQVDGIIVTSAHITSRLVEECASTGTPVVQFNRHVTGGIVHAIGCDQRECAGDVARFLVDAGHGRIAFVAGEEGSSTSAEREEGFLAALEERGLTLHMRESGDYTYESGKKAARALLSGNRGSGLPDAVFCANDLMAMGLLDVARKEFGLAVPRDLSVVGFDDIPMASWMSYSLTTVRQPIDELVDAAIEVLLAAIADPGMEQRLLLMPGNIVFRDSARLSDRVESGSRAKASDFFPG